MTKKLIIMGILMIPFLLLTRMATAQTTKTEEIKEQTFRIILNGSNDDVSKYEAAIAKADLDAYRLKSSSYSMKFESGVVVEVYSAETVSQANLLKKNINDFPEKFSAERYDSVFNLAENNFIIELRQVSYDKKTPRINE